jgi:NADH-quinone oxidoreductase subunit C
MTTEHADGADAGALAESDADRDAEGERAVHGCVTGESCGQVVVFPTREQYVELVRALADDGYVMCSDLTAVDYLQFMARPLPDGIDRERFEVVVNLLDLANRRRIRLRVQVPDHDATLPTLFDIHPGTEAMEREVFDMFGVVFTGHPDLSRILMPEDWDGHPLRKDYEIGEIPVEFKAARS